MFSFLDGIMSAIMFCDDECVFMGGGFEGGSCASGFGGQVCHMRVLR